MRVADVVEILMHWQAGRRMGELSSSLSVDPKTVRKYTAPALAAGIVPGGPALPPDQWAALVEDWFPELTDAAARQSTWPEFDGHKERIKNWIGVITVTTMHQRLRDDHGVKGSESSLRRYLKANFDEQIVREQVVVLRDTPPPGEVVRRTENVCAAPGCANPVPPRVGRVGRPPIYCSPQCRPSGRRRPDLVVEFDHDEDHQGDAIRDWVVRLRRGTQSVEGSSESSRDQAPALTWGSAGA